MAINAIQSRNSVGLTGLSHFTTSRVSMAMWEPIYLNLFTVEIQLPDAINAALGDGEGYYKNLIREGVTKVGGLDTNIVPAAGTEQHYKFASRRFANSGPEKTTIDVELEFEINLATADPESPDRTPTMSQLKVLRKWNDLIYDPLTGRMGLKAEYVSPYVKITMHDKAHQPFWQWTLHHVWPTTNLTVPNLEYMQKNTVYKVSGYKLACDYWDEVML